MKSYTHQHTLPVLLCQSQYFSQIHEQHGQLPTPAVHSSGYHPSSDHTASIPLDPIQTDEHTRYMLRATGHVRLTGSGYLDQSQSLCGSTDLGRSHHSGFVTGSHHTKVPLPQESRHTPHPLFIRERRLTNALLAVGTGSSTTQGSPTTPHSS